MKALTVWQPWASLIIVGAKPYEFRPKSYQHYTGGPAIGDRIVIHAGARPIKPAEVEDLLLRLNDEDNTTGLITDIARPLLERLRRAYRYQGLELGAGLGTVALGRPRNAGVIFRRPVADSDRRAEDNDAFNWAWPIADVARFDAPVPMRGMQGFWNWPFRNCEPINSATRPADRNL